MPALDLLQPMTGQSWLAELIARHMRVSPDEILPDLTLFSLGLDSIIAIEILEEISSVVGRTVPDSVIWDYPTLATLEAYLQNEIAREPIITPKISSFALMRTDAILPPDIRPMGPPVNTPPKKYLLTGATGFLGVHLLQVLLDKKETTVVCLVRAENESEGLRRIERSLERYELAEKLPLERLQILPGDLTLPLLGIGKTAFSNLAAEVDAVIHGAAEVNWVLPYTGLRQSNVFGTLELLRLACSGKTKPFHFVSSASVCHITNGLAEVDESLDPLTHLECVHLGYAQSKCVSEALVRQASERGLPAIIHRPSLISGNSRTKLSNSEDITSRMIQGCIKMKAAPDLDWEMDLYPVEQVAQAIGHFTREANLPLETTHLVNPEPKQWAELVLWMNLYGYPVRLMPYAQWLEKLQDVSIDKDHPLHTLRPFFFSADSSENSMPDGLSLPQRFERVHRPFIQSINTQRALAQAGLGCSELSAELMNGYFDAYYRQNLIPQPAPTSSAKPTSLPNLDASFFQKILTSGQYDELGQSNIQSAACLGSAFGNSMIARLTAWKSGGETGLFRYRLNASNKGDSNPAGSEDLNIFLKIKPSDEVPLEVATHLGSMLNEKLGQAIARYGKITGLGGSHSREIAVYQLPSPGIKLHTPRLFGTYTDTNRGVWLLALEDISKSTRQHSVDDIMEWPRADLETVLRGLAEIHGAAFGDAHLDTREQFAEIGLGSPETDEALPLWENLAHYASPFFQEWAGMEVSDLLLSLIADFGQWRPVYNSFETTLIHNDFTPRNVSLRSDGPEDRLCAYDWELARLAPPQRDWAEFLCYALTENTGEAEVRYWVERHREMLAASSGRIIDQDTWEHGFLLSLYDLLTTRLPALAMIDRVQRQTYLPRVMKTWGRLYNLFGRDKAY